MTAPRRPSRAAATVARQTPAALTASAALGALATAPADPSGLRRGVGLLAILAIAGIVAIAALALVLALRRGRAARRAAERRRRAMPTLDPWTEAGHRARAEDGDDHLPPPEHDADPNDETRG